MGRRAPNGYGCITCLKGNRSKPWLVKVTVYNEDGKGRQVPIGYEESEEKARILLAQYNDNPWDIDRDKVTFSELYKRWLKLKCPKLGKATQGSMKAAYRHCSKLYGMKYRRIKSYHMQQCIDECKLSYATQAAIKNLFYHLDQFAFECDIINKMYSQVTTAPPKPETTKKPFTEKEVQLLWDNCERENGDIPLLYIYTGFRLMELLQMTTDQINLEERTFKGGLKTANGKDRIIPIHPRIYEMVRIRLEQGNEYFLTYNGDMIPRTTFYTVWDNLLVPLGIQHTPHEARHTFRSRLDDAGANKKCIDLLMGHKSQDVGLRTYTHKTIEDLRTAINLIS